MILIGLKKKKDAIKSFQKALELKPNDLDIMSKIKNSKWAVDQQEYPVRDLYDIYNENLR